MEDQQRDINSILAGFVDRGIWYYWDTITVAQNAAGSTSYSPFSVPIGQGTTAFGSGAKNKMDTNMVRGNQFPPPRCLILDHIGFFFGSEMLKADIDLFINNYYMELRIDEKIYFEGHLWYYAPGAGLYGNGTKTAEAAWGIGLPDFRAAIHFGDYAKYIAPLQQFSLSLIAPSAPTFTSTANGGVGVRLIPMLCGLTDRAVQ